MGIPTDEPEINDRALYAIENPSVCGLEGRKPDDICMAGDLYAICYWAVTNEVGNEEEYKKITDIQNEILDLEGLQTMRNLARNMSFIIRAIADAKEKYGLPEMEHSAFTSFPDGK